MWNIQTLSLAPKIETFLTFKKYIWPGQSVTWCILLTQHAWGLPSIPQHPNKKENKNKPEFLKEKHGQNTPVLWVSFLQWELWTPCLKKEHRAGRCVLLHSLGGRNRQFCECPILSAQHVTSWFHPVSFQKSWLCPREATSSLSVTW